LRTLSGTTISPLSSWPAVSRRFQPIGVLRSLRRHHADLRQMAAQRVQHPRAIASQQFARAMAHQLRLVLDLSHRHEAHVRPSHRLADRLGVDGVVLVAPHIRLHIGRRHQLHPVAHRDQRARPMVRRAARLDPYQTRRQRSEEGQQLAPPNRFDHHHRAGGVDAMNLEHILRDIEPDSRDSRQIPDRLFHGRLPSDGSDNASWHTSMPVGAPSTPSP
jgi:hypothetical protein